MNILIEEMKRRLRNCDQYTEWNDKYEIVSELNVAMWKAGHNEKFRQVVNLRALEKHREALRRHKIGTQRMYRSREEITKQWADKGGRPDNNEWFRKGKYTGVLMVPATEGGGLESRVEQVLGRVPGPGDQTPKSD